MARNSEWISVTIKNNTTEDTIELFHPPLGGSAGEDVDRQLRGILDIQSPQPPGYKAHITITALPGPAEWLTTLAPAAAVRRAKP